MPMRHIYLLVVAATAATAVFGPATVPHAQTPATLPTAAQAPARGGVQGAGAGGAQTIPPARGRGVQGAPALDDPANANADFSPRPPVVALTPEEESKRFWLPAGYRMEPVLSDPVIQDPAQIVWDGNGRMFIVELRGYFQTPDGIDLIPPEGRISMHEDRDGDGIY